MSDSVIPSQLDVPPPWGTRFDIRDTLAAYRAEAVKVHLAATAPTQALALRRARLRGLATGTVGCGMAAAAAWLLAASLTGPAPAPLAAPLPAFKPVSMPESSSARSPAADAGLQAAVAEQPEAAAAVPAAVDSPAPAAPLPVPLLAENATTGTANSAATSPIAAPVEHAVARRHSYAEPVPARQTAARSARAPAAYDAGDSADNNASYSANNSAGYSAGYRLAVPAYDASSRPSAVAYLPPDSHITLHEHSRLIDE
ncbi:hypothetical protein [Cupriavidus basilensis]|uniref:Uncharacterized protein n=1 Tax=Cupriavidus basilensis TaxID=68895 RepID=A0A643FW13_9BURK|nr:hypothetical protein [Cupriavidus basilensis]QOT78047.1 hypothetical protein F7R26_008540 [Cupriavidus basilensis]